ncbi:protein of unknown function [Ralstonia solanacearum PSI07]|nr:protein of unknown function [Ralstonia solanacearum PSI07]
MERGLPVLLKKRATGFPRQAPGGKPDGTGIRRLPGCCRRRPCSKTEAVGSALRPRGASNRLDKVMARPGNARLWSRKRIAVARTRAIHNKSGQCCGAVVDILRKNNLSG